MTMNNEKSLLERARSRVNKNRVMMTPWGGGPMLGISDSRAGTPFDEMIEVYVQARMDEQIKILKEERDAAVQSMKASAEAGGKAKAKAREFKDRASLARRMYRLVRSGDVFEGGSDAHRIKITKVVPPPKEIEGNTRLDALGTFSFVKWDRRRKRWQKTEHGGNKLACLAQYERIE